MLEKCCLFHTRENSQKLAHVFSPFGLVYLTGWVGLGSGDTPEMVYLFEGHIFAPKVEYIGLN